MVQLDVIIQNFWFLVWKIRKKKNKNAEKDKVQNADIDKESISFREVLDKEIEKYK